MTTKTHQEYAAFLESLRVKNEGPEEMHGWRFDEKLWPFDATMFYDSNGEGYSGKAIEYLVERLRRAEANAKPPTLVEDVKAFVRAGMNLQRQYTEAELREAFEDAESRDPVHDSEVERLPSGEYKDRLVEVAWYNYCRCARHFGLIKE